jgi:hypothetical protein
MFAVLKGAITVGSEGTKHEPFHTLLLSSSTTETGVLIKALQGETELVVVSFIPYLFH